MKTLYTRSQQEVARMNQLELRQNFLIDDLFYINKINLVYLHYDRAIVGGVVPLKEGLALSVSDEIGSKYFLERRELGIINIGGLGSIEHDLGVVELKSKDGLYLPVGNKKIIFYSSDPNHPAKFYLFSTLGLVAYKPVKIDLNGSQAVHMGSDGCGNKRIIYKFFDPSTCQTNSLLMGLTILAPNNMWNTMPTHRHERRFEAYLYLDLNQEERVFHFMGEPHETKHLVLKNESFVVSPPWSIHAGVGTSNYAFIWAMGGENLTYTDMQHVKKEELQ